MGNYQQVMLDQIFKSFSLRYPRLSCSGCLPYPESRGLVAGLRLCLKCLQDQRVDYLLTRINSYSILRYIPIFFIKD